MTGPGIKISHLVVLGDSLSDRGTLAKRELLDLIPMSYLSGLSSKSPRGRFTNGFLWGDYIGASTAEQFEIEHQRKKLKLGNDPSSNADISDAFLTSKRLHDKNQRAFSLDDDKHVLFKGERFARFYCQGGLAAYDYSKSFTFNLKLLFSRLILSTLDSQRKQLLDDDAKLSFKIKLPDDVVNILKIIQSEANTMSRSNDPDRHAKGDLLKLFIFGVKCQKGNLDDIRSLISTFTMDEDNRNIIKKHKNRITDFFINKKTTHSEDNIAALEKMIEAHINAPKLN